MAGVVGPPLCGEERQSQERVVRFSVLCPQLGSVIQPQIQIKVGRIPPERDCLDGRALNVVDRHAHNLPPQRGQCEPAREGRLAALVRSLG